MNCWKSFNITKEQGSIRLILMSLFSMITFYILFNLMISTFFNRPDPIYFNPFILLIGLLLVVPGHKLTHCVPLWLTGHRVPIRFDRSELIPMIQWEIRQPISKRLCLIVMALPAFIGTLLTVFFTYMNPSCSDYCGALGSINFGISFVDFIYILKLLKAPHNAYVEDDQNGCKILIKQTS